MVKPHCLKQGDIIQVIAPASPFRREKLASGVSILEAFGLRPRWQDDIFSEHDYLAGDDVRRSGELIRAFTAPDVAGVLPVRGGYGCARTCAAAGQPSGFGPRPMVGFSDITTLHMYLNENAGFVTVHGPNITTLASLEPPTLEQYRRTLFGIDPRRNFQWTGLAAVHGGRAVGRLLVANLTVLTSLAGTSAMPDLAGRILVLEDLNEKPYRLDRMLFQLSGQPGFRAVAGVAFGDFMLEGPEDAQFARMVAAYAGRWAIPVVTGFPAGHGLRNDCVPQGVEAELDADRGRLSADSPWA